MLKNIDCDIDGSLEKCLSPENRFNLLKNSIDFEFNNKESNSNKPQL